MTLRIPQATKEGYIEIEPGGGHSTGLTSHQRQEEVGCRSKVRYAPLSHATQRTYLCMSKIINIGQTGSSQNTRVIDSEGISYAVTNGEKDGVPKIVEHNCTKQMEILEPQIAAMSGRNPDNPSERGRSNGTYKQRLEMNENGTSNTLTGVQKDNLVVEPRYRIRKLTPRECFRLMDVDDADIDKIQEAGISNSQQYKMAGNSIVVACLYHLFRKMFTEPQNEERQLTFW